MKKLLTIKELSAILHKTEATIRSDLTRDPDKLPPRFAIPRKVLWHIDDVERWLNDRRFYKDSK